MPPVMAVGGGSALVVAGWLYHENARLRRLRVRLLDTATEVRTHSIPRADVYREASTQKEMRRAFASGFWCVVPIGPIAERVGTWVTLEAENTSGAVFEQPI